MSHPVLELVEVTKWYRSNWTLRTIHAVDELSLAMDQGEVYGLIGHNGAGKTTTFKLLVGLLRPTRGSLLWDGRRLDWNSRREGIGFSPEQPYFYDYLTVGETLEFYGQLYGMSAGARRERIKQLVDNFRIGHKLKAPMRTLSKGTLQRVAVAQAIMHRPRLAILDEPMSGLDPAGRKEMRELITSLKLDGTTVLFSSHILSDAEALCDRVAILAGGRLREVVSLDKDVAPPVSYTMVVAGAPPRAIEALGGIAAEPLAGGPLRWNVKLKDQIAVRAALAALQGTDATVEAVLPERPSLEQRFLRYVSNDGAQAD
jgi:ABC-2 type transport system ATP-binding protein